jgi:hypothetical protein
MDNIFYFFRRCALWLEASGGLPATQRNLPEPDDRGNSAIGTRRFKAKTTSFNGAGVDKDTGGGVNRVAAYCYASVKRRFLLSALFLSLCKFLRQVAFRKKFTAGGID